MEITYSDTKIFSKKQLRDLFLSVEWSSGDYPEKLALAMKGYDTVYSAWDGETLVGMACAMDDGVMTAYVHYVLVNPKYQGQEIGRTLMQMLKETYAQYLKIVLIAYNDKLRFYENCGFEKSEDSSPMYISKMEHRD